MLNESSAARSPPCILVVEDEMLLQMLITDNLEDAGFCVELASSAAEAMTRLASIQDGPDCVIVDVGLPDKKGDALVRDMRALYPDLPVVIASGHDATAIRAGFEGAQKLVVMMKPYGAADMMKALATVGITPPAV